MDLDTEVRIALITYNVPHRKTQDVLARLILHGYKDITLLTTTYKKRADRGALYAHRPQSCIAFRPIVLAGRTGMSCESFNPKEDYSKRFDYILIGGANILPVKGEIINAHAGYLPHVRGLDALKWAIYDGMPIGVTTHFITDEVDCGLLIDKKIITVDYYDTFHSLAQRMYELEIKMLVDAIAKVDSGEDSGEILKPEAEVRRRMPTRLEPVMMSRFEKRRINSV